MKFLNNKASGIIIGGLYAIAIRLIFANPDMKHSLLKMTLFSITFIYIVPIIIGCIPIIFSPKDQKISVWFSIWAPAVSVLIFFNIALLTKIEDLICLWVLAVPFAVGAILGGVILRFFIIRKRKKNGFIYSLLILPLFTSMLEGQFANTHEIYSLRNTVTINTTPEKIWPQITRVKQIKEDEYPKGFFYYSGVPRPLFAEMDRDTIGAIRIGHFQGGLRFIEKVSVWERNKKILFDITADDASIGNSVFDNHILKGGHFRFVNAYYELKQVGDNKTELSLTSSYELDTKINGYASYWGQMLVDDFQARLLTVMKHRCDNL